MFVSSTTLIFMNYAPNMKVYLFASPCFAISSQQGLTIDPLRRIFDRFSTSNLGSIITPSFGVTALLATLGLTRGPITAILAQRAMGLVFTVNSSCASTLSVALPSLMMQLLCMSMHSTDFLYSSSRPCSFISVSETVWHDS